MSSKLDTEDRMEQWFRSRWARGLAHRIPMVIVGAIIGVALAFVFGLVVMAMWNWVMPAVFGLAQITYWQAWALLVLAHILFKAGSGSGDGPSKKVRREIASEVAGEVGGGIEAAIRREVQEALAKELSTGAAGERSEPGEPQGRRRLAWGSRADQ